MLKITTKTNGKSTKDFLQKLKEQKYLKILDKYGKIGVEALASATPVDTGKTASSWYYTIEIGKSSSSIFWGNSNTNKGVSIAVILDTGHVTGTGGYVQGRNYIAPTIQPIFDAISADAWKEVTNS